MDASWRMPLTMTKSVIQLPTTVGAFQRSLLDHTDAFVAKLNNTGSALVYSTYLPGLTTTVAWHSSQFWDKPMWWGPTTAMRALLMTTPDLAGQLSDDHHEWVSHCS